MSLTRLLTVSLAYTVLTAQASVSMATEHDTGAWASFATRGEFDNSRWRYWFDGQARYFDIGSGASQYVARPAVGYALNDNVTAWLGYARLETRTRSGLSAHENRYWQQLDWTAARWGGTSLTMRLRLEQRDVSVGDDAGLSLRYRLRLSHPFSESSQHRFHVSLEPFLALRDTDWGGSTGLNQNRLFVGASFAIAERWRFETGYMNQYAAFDDDEDLINHLYIARFALIPR